MEEKSVSRDKRIAIIVIIAGLISGAVVTYAFLQPEPEQEQRRYSPEYRVAEEQRVPLETLEAEESAPAEEPESGPDAPEPPTGEPDEAPAPDSSTAPERRTIEETKERMQARGVDDYAELTEELYIRVSAKMVLMASVLSETAGEDADPAEVQGLLADSAAEVLADARVDPEDFWVFTRDVHSDPERAKEMGEKILREAEKHTQQKITFEDVPGMSPTPVRGADAE